MLDVLDSFDTLA